MNWLGVLFVAVAGLTLMCDEAVALSLDPVASNELEQCIRTGDCVISMRHIRPRRKLHIAIEALFMIDFPTLKHKMSFFLDRKHQQVTLDISAIGSIESKHFKLPNINETITIRSLALHFQQHSIALFVDCKKSAVHQMESTLVKLVTQMEDPMIKLFRERKYPLHFDGTVDAALERANCQKGNGTERSSKPMLRNKFSDRDKTNKREVGSWYYQNRERDIKQPEDERRGDIPVIHGDCEDAIAKSLSELLALIKQLRDDVAQQRQEIAYLRMLLENCAGCKAPPSNLIVEPTCRTANPCYHGVECQETSAGLRCGRCPLNMVGDGKFCKPISCADRPCFMGVQCRDMLNGAECDGCPIGYEGDGRSCRARATATGSILLPSQSVQHYQRQYTARKYSVITS